MIKSRENADLLTMVALALKEYLKVVVSRGSRYLATAGEELMLLQVTKRLASSQHIILIQEVHLLKEREKRAVSTINNSEETHREV